MLAARLLAAFLDELDEQIRVWDAELLALEKEDTAEPDPTRLRALFRVAHTLKGAARAANVPLIESVLHIIESLLADVRDRTQTIGPAEVSLLLATGDALTDAARRLRADGVLSGSPLERLAADLAVMPVGGRVFGRPPMQTAVSRPPTGRAGSLVSQLLGEADPPPDHASAAGAPAADAPPAIVDAAVASEPAWEVAPAATPTEDARGARGTPAAEAGRARSEQAIRVRADKFDPLVALLGELSGAAGQSAVRAGEIQTLDATLTRWLPSWRRAARRARRTAEATEQAELAALLEDTEQHLVRLSRQLGRVTAGAERDGRTLTSVARELTGRVGDLRMRPFADVVEALPRVARDVAAAVSKEIRLELRGTHVEADRAVLDGIREAILHLVRNAIDHGIEAPAVRTARGKPADGLVVVAAALHGDRLVITVADDGQGVDAGAVRARLARSGRLATDDDRQLARAMLEGGFSTRDEANAISGRGVGLDLARAAAERLGGSLDVRWVAGGGTTFTLECPISLARIRAVLVAVGTQRVALPTAHIDHLARVSRADLARMDGRHVLPRRHGPGVASDDHGGPVPVHTLGRLLGPPMADSTPDDPLSVVVLHAGRDRCAVVVDAVLDERELVLRTLPPGHTVSPHVAGAATLPGGSVALVLSAASLVAAGLAAGAELTSTGSGDAHAVRRRMVLVVDDSITTRTLEQSVLEGGGYDVITAVDGVDALRQLDMHECDVVISDVEMPRMDGIALCEAIRSSPQWVRLPVVLVTAQEADEDRMRGLAAGADAYLGKSAFDQQHLLDIVRQLIG